nr:PREDICTED: uncharacterized protein LOC109034849 [Bemisia tabaci]
MSSMNPSKILTSFFSPLRQLLTCVASSTSLIDTSSFSCPDTREPIFSPPSSFFCFLLFFKNEDPRLADLSDSDQILDKLKFIVDNYSEVKIKINSYVIRTASSEDEKRGLSIVTKYVNSPPISDLESVFDHFLNKN